MQYIDPSYFVPDDICLTEYFLNKHSKYKRQKTYKSLFGIFCHEFTHSYINKELTIESFNREWASSYDKFINRQNDIDHLSLPKVSSFERYIKDYRKIKNNLFKRISNRVNQSFNNKHTHNELKVEYQGITGYIDFVLKKDNEIILFDNKFGNIYDKDRNIKPFYINQLYIYAALYLKTYNESPTKLIITDNNLKNHTIKDYNIQNCELLLDKLLDLNNKINNIKDYQDSMELANPKDEKCIKCFNNQSCDIYWSDYHNYDNDFNNIKCKIDSIEKTLRGYTLYVTDDKEKKISIHEIIPSYIKLLGLNQTVVLKSIKKYNDKFYFGSYSNILIKKDAN